MLLATIPNPLDGLTPDFSVFGVAFTATWQKLLVGVWAMAIIIAIFFLIRGLVTMGQARGGGHPQEMRHAKTEAVWAGISLGALAALAVIVGAIFAVFS